MQRLRRARPLMVGLSALALLTSMSVWARAAGATLSITPAVGPPTAKVQAIGTGFEASEVVDLDFDGMIVAHASTDPHGSFSRTLTIPRSATPGDHEVTATGESSGTTALTNFLVRTDWAQFHFNAARTGLNPYENVLSPSTVGGLHVKWTLGALSEVREPVVAGGVVYFGDTGVADGRDFGHLYAVDAVTGASLWTQAVPGCGGSPAVAGGLVYTATCLGSAVRAFDAKTGEFQWSQSAGGGMFGSPAVAYGMVYEGSNDGYLYAWDAKTGTQRWKAPLTSGAGGVPAAVSGGLVFLGGFNLDFYAFDAFTGDLVWTTRMRNYTQGATVADGVLYVGTFNSAPYRIYALDAATGGNLWSREMPAFVGTSPAIRSHTLYITTGNEIRALNASTGETRWSFTAGDIINLSAPAVANGIVCVGSFDDSIYALNASTGQLLWSYQTGGHVGYSPAVVDGTLYVGSFDHTLYAFGLPEQRYSRSPGGWLGDVELRRLHGTLIE